MKLNTPIPVRFDSDTARQLQKVSDATGIPTSHLIRESVKQYLDEVLRQGKITIPLNKGKLANAKND